MIKRTGRAKKKKACDFHTVHRDKIEMKKSDTVHHIMIFFFRSVFSSVFFLLFKTQFSLAEKICLGVVSIINTVLIGPCFSVPVLIFFYQEYKIATNCTLRLHNNFSPTIDDYGLPESGCVLDT